MGHADGSYCLLWEVFVFLLSCLKRVPESSTDAPFLEALWGRGKIARSCEHLDLSELLSLNGTDAVRM